MIEEIKKLVGEIKSSYETMKSENAVLLAGKAEKGYVDAAVQAKVDAINADITVKQDKLSARLSELEANRKIDEALGRSHSAEAVREEMKAFADTLAAASNDESVRRQAEGLVTREFLSAYKTGFNKLIRFGEKAARLSPEEKAAMEVGSDPKGGYLLPPHVSGRVAELQYESTPMRQIATVETCPVDRFPIDLDLDEVDAGWVGERGARTETDVAELGKQEIVVHELYANPAITQKLLDMGSNPEERLARKIASKMSRLENTGFVTGNGVLRPRGFTTYTAGTPSAATWNRIQQINSGASGAFASSDPGDKLIDMVHALKAPYHANARWMMGRLTLAAVRKLQDGQGNYLWQADFTQGATGTLLGFPITIGEDLAALASASLSLAFGDFKAGYTIVDGIGMRTLIDPYTNKPKVHFYTTKRVGGDVSNFEALKLMKFSA